MCVCVIDTKTQSLFILKVSPYALTFLAMDDGSTCILTEWARAEEDDDDEDAPEIEDHYNDPDEDDDAFDDDKLTEESYRTTFEDKATYDSLK